MKIEFVIHEAAQGKGRPRFVHKNNVTWATTPTKTRSYENTVKYEYLEQCGAQKLKAPLRVTIEAIYEPPASWSKVKRNRYINEKIGHTKKPDTDNIAKAILDALNEIAFDDDAGITELIVTKYYGEKNEVKVQLQELPK